MRHFAHNIGDYAAATAHLTFLEDAAYHRLLRRYYQDERPLPVELADCQRLVGARSKEEKAAVRAILAEFFTLADDGWHQVRADREIEAYHAKAEAARANGTKGGRPANRQKTNPVTPQVQSEKPTKNHSPLPTPHCVDAPVDASQPGQARPIGEDWNPTEEQIATLRKNRPDLTGAYFDERMGAFRLWCKAKAVWTHDEGATWLQFMLGSYVREERGGRGKGAPAQSDLPPEEPWEKRIADFRKSKFWMSATWGPAPGQPGCRAPRELLRSDA